ncbi:MAG: 30S ribosomal protein S8e [Candidatus Bathyarchaeia archaeon]
MSVWHGSLHKKKLTGGKKRVSRGKRSYETGRFPAETILGEPKTRVMRGYGGNVKVKVLSAKYASVTDPKSGKTEKAEILRVVKNAANVDYDRRGVITKGAEIETTLGIARVTSRPGSDGVINAVLLSSKKEKS